MSRNVLLFQTENEWLFIPEGECLLIPGSLVIPGGECLVFPEPAPPSSPGRCVQNLSGRLF